MKILFLSSADIFNPYGNGGVKASREHLLMLQNYFGKENVDIGVFPKKGDYDVAENVKKFKRTNNSIEQLLAALAGCKIYLPWDERTVIEFVLAKSPDILFLDFSTLGRLTRIKGNHKTVVFFHNVESDYAMNKVKNEGVRYLPSYWASKKNDKYAIQADMIICLNKRDATRIYELYGRKADFLWPITLSDRFDQRKTQNEYKREILFLGSLFISNQISIEWFIDQVMPRLDNITLNIVGENFEKLRDKYEKVKNVKVIGSVDEVDGYYYRHCAVVMPIIAGAGMKVKTAEAMMFGRRIFASSEALEGYDVDGISGITLCNTPDEYASAINDYYDSKCIKPYEVEVRNYFLEKHESKKGEEKFGKSIERLIDKDE